MEKLISSRLFGKKIKGSLMHRMLVALQLACALTWNSSLYANPTDGNVVAGAANISQSGHVLKVDQSSNRAIINWGGFSIGAGETVKFNQPGPNSAILNRVIGSDPSAIMGAMQSNGQVFLINPNGIVFGAGARVDVGSIVASTLNISDSQFMAGSGTYDFKGNSKAGVHNFGEIRALQGDIYLIGASVSNSGLLKAAGTVGMAAGQDVRLVDSAYPHLVVRATSESIGGTGVSNSGTIEALQAELVANGGNVYALAINNTGTIRATGSKTVGGRVYLTAEGGDIATSGDIIAKQGTDGGYVEINNGGLDGSLVSINGNIDVSGIEKGGAVFVRTANLNLVGSNINTSGAISGMTTIVFGEDSIIYEGPTPGNEVVNPPGTPDATDTGTLDNPSGVFSDRTDLSGGIVDVRSAASSGKNDLVVVASSSSDSLEAGNGSRIVADGGGTLENVVLEARPIGYNPGNAYSSDTIYNAFNNIQFSIDGSNGQPVTVTIEGFKADGTPFSFSITDNLGPGNDTFHFQDDGAGYVMTKVSINGTTAGTTEIADIKVTSAIKPTGLLGSITVWKYTTGGDDTFEFTTTGGSTLPSTFTITTTDGSGGRVFDGLALGYYGISENVPEGWRLVNSYSTNGTPDNFTFDANGNAAVFFFNEKLGQIIVQKSILTGSANNPDFDFSLDGNSQDVDFSLAGGDSIQSGSGMNDLPYLEPGETYTVAELLGLNGQPTSGGAELPNWDFNYVVITKNGVALDLSTNASQQFMVAPGDEFSFNFTNTERGQILISKSVSDGSSTSQAFNFTASGGPSTVGNFTLSQDDGQYALPDTSSGSPVNYLKPGGYTITELAEAGWFFDGIDPVSGVAITNNQAAVKVTPGGSVSLVFHNTQGGEVTVTKNVSAGSDTSKQFNFTTTGGPSVPGASFVLSEDAGTFILQDKLGNGFSKDAANYLRPGDYTITELAEAGWFFDGIDPVSGAAITNNQAVVTVTPGGRVDLVFNNTQGGVLNVSKSVYGDENTEFDFTASGGPSNITPSFKRSNADGTLTLQDLDGNGITSDPVDYLRPGTYTVKELAELGWFFDFVTGAQEFDNPEATVTINPGQTKTLRFYNTQGAQVMVTKDAFGPAGSTTDFDFIAERIYEEEGDAGLQFAALTPGVDAFGPNANSYPFILKGGESTKLSEDPQPTYVRPGTYRVTELAELGWFFDGITGADFVSGQSGEVYVGPGDVKSLTFYNSQAAQIIVTKNTMGPNGENTPFNFFAEPGPQRGGGGTIDTQFVLKGGESIKLSSNEMAFYVRPGTYTVGELSPTAPWFFNGITGADSVIGQSGTVTVGNGEVAMLTFTNVYQLPIFTFNWDPIYPEGSGSGFPSYGSPDSRPEGELTGNSSAGVFQP